MSDFDKIKLGAVVHQEDEEGLPKGGFACHVRDLRIVKRLTTD